MTGSDAHDAWVDEAVAEAGPCPACGATAAKPILWGYPAEEDVQRLGDSVVWGGCCLPPEPAAFACSVCGEEYGVWRSPADPL